MMSQYQMSTKQASARGAPSATTGTTVINGDTGNHLSVSAGLSDTPRRGAAEDGDTTHTLVNPWRELDRDAFVIAYAVRGTARCGACLSKVAQGELQLGAFYTHEDQFTLVRWYHQQCVVAPECLRDPMDLCGIEDLKGDDLHRVVDWMGCGSLSSLVKDRSWTA